MSFMQPETVRGCVRVECVRTGESAIVPTGYDGAECLPFKGPVEREPMPNAWIARLSAPGYMDCTEWDGPYTSEEAALKGLASTLDVCSECFEQCWDDAESECSIAVAERDGSAG